jgi:ABC-type molybdenum transport system ATPase subunit/photorepair protein PhrA
MITPAFHARVNGRLFRITPLESFPASGDDWVPVDCRDVRSTFESQAIIGLCSAQTPESVIAEDQVRDAIRSAYLNATSRESGRYPVGGDSLPEDFKITLVQR